MRIDDPDFDSAAPGTRDAFLVTVLRRQIAFMRSNIPFWNERLSAAGVHEDQIETLADLGRIPIFSKEDLRALRPADLLPKQSLLDLKICRWTSGTTGRPTVTFWTETDWAALVGSTARMLSRQAPFTGVSAFNGYSQAHLTGPLYSAALRTIGAVVFDRSHHTEDQFPTPAQMDLFDFNTVVLPGRTTRGKGLGIAELLAEDAHGFARRAVRWWIGSSETFNNTCRALAQEQGVTTVTNLYGSSEFGLFAISCKSQPSDFHVAQGYVLVEVVDPTGTPVADGQAGRIVVTHLSGMDEHGDAQLHTGTQILRLAGGDSATLLTGPCSCGLNAARLRNIGRINR